MTLPMLVWARQPASQLQAPGLRHGGAGRPRPAVLRPRGPGTVGSGFCRPSVLVYRELGGSTGSAEQAPHQGQPPSLVGPAPWAAVASHSPPTDSQAEGRQLDLASQRPGASQRARSAPPWPALRSGAAARHRPNSAAAQPLAKARGHRPGLAHAQTRAAVGGHTVGRPGGETQPRPWRRSRAGAAHCPAASSGRPARARVASLSPTGSVQANPKGLPNPELLQV